MLVECLEKKNQILDNLTAINKKQTELIQNEEFSLSEFDKCVEEKGILIENILKYSSNENDLILDCFSGSGTTAVACHNLKRRFICIEKDYDYWKASVERLENAQAQLKLF